MRRNQGNQLPLAFREPSVERAESATRPKVLPLRHPHDALRDELAGVRRVLDAPTSTIEDLDRAEERLGRAERTLMRMLLGDCATRFAHPLAALYVTLEFRGELQAIVRELAAARARIAQGGQHG